MSFLADIVFGLFVMGLSLMFVFVLILGLIGIYYLYDRFLMIEK